MNGLLADTIGGAAAPVAAAIKRVSISEPGGTSHTFRLNPSDYQREKAPRASVVPTLGAFGVDHYGEGLGRITIAGTTGRGFLVELRAIQAVLDAYHASTATGQQRKPMKFHNWTDGEHYSVLVTSFRVTRNERQPLLYRYHIEMSVLGADVTRRTDPPLLIAIGTFNGSVL